MLLKHDERLVDYSFEGRAPLSMAGEIGDTDITRLLIRAGADVHAVDEVSRLLLKDEPLKTFLPPHDLLLQIERLLQTHSPTNRPPLLLAARRGHVKLLREFLNANADVNPADTDQWTALAWAVKNGHKMAVVALLYTLGVHVDPRIPTSHTPFMIAARFGRTKILELLLKFGANVNSEDYEKWTPLFWAVSNGREQAVVLFLKESKTGVDHQDRYGRTPFSLAAEHSFIKIINLLLDHGGDPLIPDDEGHTGLGGFLKARHDLCIRFSNTSIRPRHGGTVNHSLLTLLIWTLQSSDRKDQSSRSWLLNMATRSSSNVEAQWTSMSVTETKLHLEPH